MENRNHVLKRVLACVMVVVMAVTAVPMSGFVGLELPKWSQGLATQASAATSGYYTYTVSNGKATISRTDSSLSGNVTIPSKLGGYPVTAIGDSAFENLSGIKSVTIPNSVTSISYNAFNDCTGLASITIPDSVLSIGRDAFFGTAWYNAQPYGDVYAGKVYYEYKGTMPENTSIVIKSGTKGIAESAFQYCDGLTSVTIPNSVTNIGDSAFVRCSGLKRVTIPDSVTSIGESAFSECTGMTSVTIGNGVTSIGESAFSECTGMTSVTIGNGVTSIGESAFRKCTGMTSVTIGNSVTSIGGYAFSDCAGLTKINWNAKGISAFYDMKPVFLDTGTAGDGIDVVFGDNVKSIPANAFLRCTGLTSVTISGSVTSIGASAFSGCTGLSSITIPDSVTSIGHSAFSGCTGLTSITIPDSVSSIDDYTFVRCTGLSSITIPDSVTSIGGYAFADTAWYNAQPFGDVYAGKVYYKYKGTIPKNTSVVIKNGTKGIAGSAFYDCDGLTSITIPDSVTSVGDSAFFSCRGLKNITIPGSVTSIGDHAFYYCTGLTGITIPDSVTSIGKGAFADCIGFTHITIPDSVTELGSGAFRDCSNLTSATIGNGVKTISSGAFGECPLTTIKLGKSIKTIEANAFTGIKSIPEVYYAGSEAEWKNISIDPSNDMILRAKMHYNVNLSHTHSYTAKITKKATCTSNGVKTYTCNCGKTVTKSIPATGHKYKTENQAASCTSIGVSIKKCTVCGKVEYANTTPAKGHTLETDITPATFTESGLSTTSCKTCGTITKATLIKRIASVTLSATKYAYNGKTQTPTVVVKDSSGKVLKNKTDYTVSYASGRKNPGKYAVKVTFKGNYTGTKTLYFTISPTAPSLTVTAGAKKATLKWNKQVGATGYVVYMATSKNGKYSRIAVLKGNSAVSYTKTGLTTGRTYYFKIASYTTSGTSNIYSAWSSVKGVKIK